MISGRLPLVCIRCGAEGDPAPHGRGCERCRAVGVAANLRTDYDLTAAGERFIADLTGPLGGIARYRALLPIEPDDSAAAATAPSPLLPAPRLAAAIGLDRLWIKDESRGLTWSFKDRAAAIAAHHARSLGIGVLVTASTGNAAAATAAHARRAGLTGVVVFARGVDPLMAAFVAGYGAHIAIADTKRDRWRLVGEAVEQYGWYPMSNYSDPPVGNNPYAIDGYKPIAYETWEQLGRSAPDAMYFPICYGDAVAGSRRAFAELVEMGLAAGVPEHCGGEIYGSVSAALASGSDTVPLAEIDHPTSATSISAAQSTFQALQAIRDSGGAVHTVSEDELADAARLAACTEGVLLETAAAAGLAALTRHIRDGTRRRSDEVVLVASSTGLKSLGSKINEGITAHQVDDVAGLAELAQQQSEVSRR
ncbi:threonine synthase [Mycolicibacterium hippocampi]|uniref:Threonine synthase n=1 Tax=Mycolicibacterium hippocampi TaxID=659824 RepID=A0A7I9ZQH9_9MYCO|nr:pyridoxal-phosphate dependent enzyme [Mycolicibacterium hippocampi]GFH02946.1 threonine synthase [Mycolicibacterium hippocampi]